jgi:predicted amidohydrolase
MSHHLCSITASVLLLAAASAGCAKGSSAEADLGVEADTSLTVDKGQLDQPYVPLGDSGKPLWDIKVPKGDLGKGKDLPQQQKDKGVAKDAYVPPDLPIANTIKVAAVQYGPDLYSFAPGCTDDLCGLSYFVTQAKNGGATYVVTPEGALPQKTAEMSPSLGDKPGQNPIWASSPIMKTMSTLADNLNITLLFNVIAQEGSGTTAKLYNTEITVDGSGTVVSRHYKYYLYGESWTPGTSCCDFFQTPVGQAGSLICADINCIVDLAVKGNCSATALSMMNSYAGKKPYLTFFSSFWMSTGSLDPYWQPNQVQSKFAKYASTYMVAANIIYQNYHGGGVYRPDGTPISVANTTTPSVAYGVIPKQGTTLPNPPPPTPKVVITELMMNPSAVADAKGEWIELYNAGSTAVDLGGWTVRDGTPGMADMLSTHSLGPGQYVVIGSSTNKAENGGVTIVSAWNSFGLANTSSKVQLHDAAGTLVDEVSYGSGWPLPTGASISLKSPGLDNSQAANWCAEKTAWSGSAGDKGTPGGPAGCP